MPPDLQPERAIDADQLTQLDQDGGSRGVRSAGEDGVGELADAVLSGGSDVSSPAVLTELCQLIGVEPA